MERKIRNEKLLEAVRFYFNNEKVNWEEEWTEEEWIEFFKLSSEQQVLPMIYDTVYECPAFQKMTPQSVQMIKSKVFRNVMMQTIKTEEFLQLYQKLLNEGLTPLVVKGLICRNLYREPDYRSSGDEDVFIPKEQFRTCHDLFLKQGLCCAETEETLDQAGEVTYFRRNSGLHIELHKELFSSSSEAYGDLNRFFEKAAERKMTVRINEVSVYTMGPTDHLLYLILHAFKHFLHSGFGIRQVCDIIAFANTYGPEIDWNEILRKCKEIHADVFAASLFDIGEKKLQFDRKMACYPESWTALQADGEDLLEDLLDAGVFGDSSMSRKHSSNMTLQAVVEEKKGKKRKTSIFQSLFPGREYMERTYTYVKKHPFLLPAAWVERLVKYWKETGQFKNNTAFQSIEIGNQRVELLRKYKIIE